MNLTGTCIQAVLIVICLCSSSVRASSASDQRAPESCVCSGCSIPTRKRHAKSSSCSNRTLTSGQLDDDPLNRRCHHSYTYYPGPSLTLLSACRQSNLSLRRCSFFLLFSSGSLYPHRHLTTGIVYGEADTKWLVRPMSPYCYSGGSFLPQRIVWHRGCARTQPSISFLIWLKGLWRLNRVCGY